MTVTSNESLTDWLIADGANKNWSYDFALRLATDVYVQVRDGTDNETIVEYTSNFSWTKTSDETGFITFPVAGDALAVGKQLRLVRDLPLTQEVQIGQEGISLRSSTSGRSIG